MELENVWVVACGVCAKGGGVAGPEPEMLLMNRSTRALCGLQGNAECGVCTTFHRPREKAAVLVASPGGGQAIVLGLTRRRNLGSSISNVLLGGGGRGGSSALGANLPVIARCDEFRLCYKVE